MDQVSFSETVDSLEHSLDKDYHRGELYFSLMEFDLSLASFKEFLSREEKKQKDETMVIANIYNHIALCYFYLFDYQNAIHYMLKAISIKEKFLSENDKSLIISKLNLEDIYKALEKEERGEALRKYLLSPFKYLMILKYKIFSVKN